MAYPMFKQMLVSCSRQCRGIAEQSGKGQDGQCTFSPRVFEAQWCKGVDLIGSKKNCCTLEAIETASS